MGKYARVTAEFIAEKGAQLSFGVNNSTLVEEKIWQCHAVSCGQPQENVLTLVGLPASEVTGNVQLADDASLRLGKVVYQGQ